MAETKFRFSTVVLFVVMLIFYVTIWQESKESVVPVPITFRSAYSLTVQKTNTNIHKDSRHINATNISTLSSQNFVSHILIPNATRPPPYRIREKTNLISKGVDNIGVGNISENGSTLDEKKWNENEGMQLASLDVTSRLRNSKESLHFVTNVSILSSVTHSPNLKEENENNTKGSSIPTNIATVEESRFNENRNFKVSLSNLSKIDGDTSKKPCIKQIQLWAHFKFSQFQEKEYSCPEEKCKARFVHSNSYDKLKTTHAVILHHKGSWNWKDLARSRPDGQLWIYMTKESPIHSRNMISEHDHHLAFNWSMTYHTESDFVIPYGRYIEGIPEIHANDTRNWASGKTRVIAWMASNCGVTSWPRNQFVKNLKRFIQVDTYGACGRLKCPRRGGKCGEILSSHKFYLSLENSECQDYITEKFWRNAFAHHLVPIVYGTTRKDYEKVAPPNSFIHLSDFRNMTSLVDYIKYLDTNDTAYNEYFEWRKRGSTAWYNEAQLVSPEGLLCSIVHKLRNIKDKNTEGKQIKPEVADFQNWWKPSCMHKESVWGH